MRLSDGGMLMKNYVITISRLCGSGGSTVARLLSQKLAIPLYDRHLLSDAEGCHAESPANAEEAASPLFHASQNIYAQSPLPPEGSEPTTNRALFQKQAEIIRRLADTESCIIIGRCADFVLRDHPNVIRIFITSDEKSCIAHEAQRVGISKREARSLVEKHNQERSQYYRYYTGQDWSYAQNYDLCLNTATLSYEACADMIIQYISHRKGN